MTGMPLLFLDISGGEFFIIMIVAFFVFGPKKLPEVARKIGRTMNEIKNVSNQLTSEFREETSKITSELKSAREVARVNAEVPDIDLNAGAVPYGGSELNKRKSISVDKPSAEVNVSKDSNNNDNTADVNPKTDN